ncbi:hypothetical protein [Streptomyces sp. NBC_01264]|uniref:hypothetical protein n=1 Tax=Streptomyces sp. NBC_01264 TaxID=2903804 RepID=UPI00224D0C74|nr:hypothetical protein [Streptomyces sp. NBC_01264]MCX4781905.1 hypothetical protein [Streptomyces sp. NBC_01264]
MADGQDWEDRNRAAYGTVAWRRAVLTCGALVVWHTGYDNRTEPGPAGPRPGRPDAPDGAQFTSRWMPVVALLALAACRVAREADVLVDDVELSGLVGWVDGGYTGRLHQGPLETGERRGRTAEGWLDLVGDEKRRRRARQVLEDHLGAHGAEEGEPADTRGGTEPLPLTIGDRARAVRAAGIADLEPEWAGDVARARARLERLSADLSGGLWSPGPRHRAFAGILHGTLVATPDFPSLPASVPGPLWVQRVLRMPHITSTVRTLTDLPEFAMFGPQGDTADPLGNAVDAVAHQAAHSLAKPAADLEQLWAARPADQSVARWERAHLPPPVREQVLAVEELTHELATVLLAIANPGAEQ